MTLLSTSVIEKDFSSSSRVILPSVAEMLLSQHDNAWTEFQALIFSAERYENPRSCNAALLENETIKIRRIRRKQKVFFQIAMVIFVQSHSLGTMYKKMYSLYETNKSIFPSIFRSKNASPS